MQDLSPELQAIAESLSPAERQTLKIKLAMKRSFHGFFMAVPPKTSYIYGRHTMLLMNRLTRVVQKVEQRQSQYEIFCMPPRHGKSDTASRRFPAWVLCKHPEWEYMLGSYNSDMAVELSTDVKSCFQRLGPMFNVSISPIRDLTGSWRTSAGGAMYAVGLRGTVTGRGAHILTLDDYLKSREDAESLVIRNKIWDSFRHDFMTRLAPVHAVIIVANRWHQDDLVGRIQKANDPASESYDPDFPVFNITNCQAQSEDGSFLFPERFDEAWYRAEKAFAGTYGWSAQFQQEPEPRTGNMLKAEVGVNIHIVDNIEEHVNGTVWEWGFDMASSEQERKGDDPDYTHGTLAAVMNRTLYLKDVIRIRSTAVKRDEAIVEAVKSSGAPEANIEVVGGYKDSYMYLKNLLQGHCIVHKVTVQRDLIARASHYEPIFEIGHVYIQRAPWNEAWLKEIRSFGPGSTAHDDAIASLIAATYKKIAKQGGFKLER